MKKMICPKNQTKKDPFMIKFDKYYLKNLNTSCYHCLRRLYYELNFSPLKCTLVGKTDTVHTAFSGFLGSSKTKCGLVH